MTGKLIISFAVLICVSASGWAQKAKTVAKKPAAKTVALSNAEKMGYSRTNKYWGPGTYYAFAPGVTAMKMVNTAESAMRDLTGISKEDFYTEIGKQGFVELQPREVQKWHNENNSKEKKFFYSPDKSYILKPDFKDMEKTAVPGFMPVTTGAIERYVLVPKQDSLKVMEMAWQYLRDLNEMKVLLSSIGSTFKKANPKAFPIEQVGTSGWSSFRAGSFVLRMVDGKPKGAYERDEDIIRRTIGKPEFELRIMGCETDFWYSMRVKLQKEGYVIAYSLVNVTMNTLEPGANWFDEHKKRAAGQKGGELLDKQAVEVYKKAPLPPVMDDLNKLLHI